MPYKVFKDGDQFCVHKENPDGSKGDQIGCHPTEEKAQAQMKAVYANEKKEVEGEGLEGIAGNIVENILKSVNIVDKIPAIKAVVDAFDGSLHGEKASHKMPPPPSVRRDEHGQVIRKPTAKREDRMPGKPKTGKDPGKRENDKKKPEKKNPPAPDRKKPKKKLSETITDAITYLGYRIKKPDEGRKKSFLITKTRGGGYRWLAVYSNNYRDRDNPPEIISAQAHERYVKELDVPLWPMPILEFWHVKGTRFGVADMVAYEPETGFAIATGTIDKGHEHRAERLKELIDKGADIRVSHGFPEQLIERESRDKSVITRYVTQEISVLPGRAAANALTGFSIDKKEAGMALPDSKKKFLRDVGEFDEDQIKQLEQDWQEKAKEGAGLERKEAEAPEAAPEEATEEVAEEAVEEVTREEVVEGLGAAVTPLVETAEAQAEEIKQLKEQVSELASIVKELKKGDDAKIAEKAAETPRASIAAMFVKSMENRRTPIEKSDPLAKKEPALPVNMKNKGNGRTGLFFDEFITQ